MPFLKAALLNGAALWQQPLNRVGAVTIVAANAVMSLAWWLANDRIGLCRTPSCPVLATAARDATMVNGVTIDLVTVLALVLAGIKSRAKPVGIGARVMVGEEVAGRPMLKVLGVAQSIDGKRLRLRALLTAVAFGMALAGGLLWAAGLLRLSRWPGSAGGIPVNGSSSGAPANPFERFVPDGRTNGVPGKRAPVDLYYDFPVAAPPSRSDDARFSGVDAAAGENASGASAAFTADIDE